MFDLISLIRPSHRKYPHLPHFHKGGAMDPEWPASFQASRRTHRFTPGPVPSTTLRSAEKRTRLYMHSSARIRYDEAMAKA